MSDDIGPGDYVECVETDLTSPPRVVAGSIYRVREVGKEGRCDCMLSHRPWAFNHAGLKFEDARDPDEDRAWCSYMFRPISRRSDFERFLTEVKMPIEALTVKAPKVEA